VKFLLDMGLARSTADFLRRQGYDAVHLREQGLQRMEDHDIVSKARTEGRVILTHDLDFGRIIALSQNQLPSLITFRLSNMQPHQVNHYLAEVLDRFAEQLESGALVSVSERAIRVRPLPVGDVESL
jgi:predicted nuclease of predicted toxin-antitoxin system